MKKFIILSLILKTGLIFTNPIVNEIFTILQSGANLDYIGEPVSQLEHALQCAQQALDAKCDDETILACLLHDIGHLCADKNAKQMDGFGIKHHELITGEFLKAKGFSHKTVELAKSHVDAKRYLVFKKGDEYYNKLSDASKETLKRQGGMMTSQEAQLFETDPLFIEKINLRIFDEKAKVKGAKTKDINFFKDLCLKKLQNK